MGQFCQIRDDQHIGKLIKISGMGLCHINQTRIKLVMIGRNHMAVRTERIKLAERA